VDSKIVDLPSKLEKPVQEIIKLIFNINLMKDVMKEMEVNNLICVVDINTVKRIL